MCCLVDSYGSDVVPFSVGRVRTYMVPIRDTTEDVGQKSRGVWDLLKKHVRQKKKKKKREW